MKKRAVTSDGFLKPSLRHSSFIYDRDDDY